MAVRLLAVLASCSGPRQAATDGPALADASDVRREGSAITEAVPSTCAVEVLRVRIQRAPGTGSSNERIAVIWGDVGREAGLSPPRIAFDRAIDGRVSNDTEIVLSQVLLPFEESLVCTRACRERDLCPCTESPRVALASVVVALDSNGDGVLSLEEAREGRRAEGEVVVGWSPRRYVPPPVMPYFWEETFPQGIEAGLCPYRVRRGEQLDDFMRPMDPAEGFDAVPCAGWLDCRTHMPRF